MTGYPGVNFPIIMYDAIRGYESSGARWRRTKGQVVCQPNSGSLKLLLCSSTLYLSKIQDMSNNVYVSHPNPLIPHFLPRFVLDRPHRPHRLRYLDADRHLCVQFIVGSQDNKNSPIQILGTIKFKLYDGTYGALWLYARSNPISLFRVGFLTDKQSSPNLPFIIWFISRSELVIRCRTPNCCQLPRPLHRRKGLWLPRIDLPPYHS
jgi:hypothetical protein